MDRPVIVCGFGRVGRRVLDYLRAAQLTAVIVDLRNIYKPADMVEKGFTYVSIGRG